MRIRWSAAAVGREVAHSVLGWQAEFFKLIAAFLLYFKRLFKFWMLLPCLAM
jgi:hypothetical protein